MSSHPMVLVAEPLCPYAQRVAIVLAEKQLPYERRDVDLADRPEWFEACSPLGKVPLLIVGDVVLFESSVIVEYLDDSHAPTMLPVGALERASAKAWIEFASSCLGLVSRLYAAPDLEQLCAARAALHQRFQLLERMLGDGPFFQRQRFGLVDAAFAPLFRYFDVFERGVRLGLDDDRPKVGAWRRALAQRPSVRAAVPPDYTDRLLAFVVRKGAALALLLNQALSEGRPVEIAAPRTPDESAGLSVGAAA